MSNPLPGLDSGRFLPQGGLLRRRPWAGVAIATAIAAKKETPSPTYRVCRCHRTSGVEGGSVAKSVVGFVEADGDHHDAGQGTDGGAEDDGLISILVVGMASVADGPKADHGSDESADYSNEEAGAETP